MLPQQHRRYWHDGWQLSASLASLVTAVVYAITQPVERTTPIFGLDLEMLAISLGAAVLGALLWLPIAWVSWRPYVITPPGLDED